MPITLILSLAAMVFQPSAGALESKSSRFKNLSYNAGGETVSAAPRAGPAPADSAPRFSTAIKPAPPRTIVKIRRVGFRPRPKAAQPVYPSSRPRLYNYVILAGTLVAILGAWMLWSLRTRRARDAEIMGLVAHELKSPLTAIESYLDLMAHEGAGGSPAEARRWLEDVQHVKSTAGHLRATISDLLEMTRLDSGKMRLALEPVDLKALAEDTLRFYGAQAQEAGVSLSLEAERGLPAMSADPGRIRQVLRNLVSNAIKFTPRGGRVSVRLRGEGARTVCSVADTGKGIAPKDRKRLFGKFARLAPSATGSEGTGLGLYIAKTIVEAHGGEIGHEAAPGRGSVFSFWLPAGVKAHA